MRVMLACFVEAMRENIWRHHWRELEEAEPLIRVMISTCKIQREVFPKIVLLLRQVRQQTVNYPVPS